MREGRGLFYTACVEHPTRHRRARGGGLLREVAMLGSTCSARGGRCVQSSRWLGVCGPSAPGALGVGVAPSSRSCAAASVSSRRATTLAHLAAPLPRRAAVHSSQVGIDVASMQQRRVDNAARFERERARDLAEMMRINNAQADERACVDAHQAAALARNLQL